MILVWCVLLLFKAHEETLQAQQAGCAPMSFIGDTNDIIPASIASYPSRPFIVRNQPLLPQQGGYAPRALDSLRLITKDGADNIYLSFNGGWSWVKVWQIPGISSLAYLSREIIVGFAYIVGSTKRVLFRSTDGGWSWDTVTLPFAPSRPNLVMVDSAPPVLVWMAWNSAGIWVSRDTARTWRFVPFPEEIQREEPTPMAIAYSAPTLYCLVHNRSRTAVYLLLSRDLGQTWECRKGLEPIAWHFRGDEVFLTVVPPDTLFIVGYRGGPVQRVQRSWILRSTDGGASWRYVFHDSLMVSSYYLLLAQPGRLERVAPGVYMGAELGLFFSTDGGESWMIDTTFQIVGAFKKISPWTVYMAYYERQPPSGSYFPAYLTLSPLVSVEPGLGRERNGNQLRNPFNEGAYLELYSILGNRIMRRYCLPQEVVQLPRLSFGVYLLCWRTAKGSIVQQLVMLE